MPFTIRETGEILLTFGFDNSAVPPGDFDVCEYIAIGPTEIFDPKSKTWSFGAEDGAPVLYDDGTFCPAVPPTDNFFGYVTPLSTGQALITGGADAREPDFSFPVRGFAIVYTPGKK